MGKEELLNFLSQNINYFKNVSIEDFNLLANLDSSELGLVDRNNYQVISLIKQIADYSLIKEVLNDEQIMDIRNSLPDDNSDILYDCLDIVDKCNQYIKILFDEDCRHPSVTNSINLIVGAGLYDVVLDIISELIIHINDKFQDGLIDLTNIVDEKIVEIPDFIFEQIKGILSNGLIFLPQDLLLYLSNYAKNYLITKFGFPVVSIQDKSHNQIYYIDDWYINIRKDSKVHLNFNLKISHFLESYALIMERVNEYKDYNDDMVVMELINDLEEGYHLYESYKYRFLKDDYREQKILEKCKKL